MKSLGAGSLGFLKVGCGVVGFERNDLAAKFLGLADVAVPDVAFPFHSGGKVAGHILPVRPVHEELARGAGMFDDQAGRSGVQG